MKTPDQFARLLGTATCFSVFGIAGLIMGLVFFPLLFVFVRDSRVRKTMARKAIGKAFGAFLWLMKTVGVMDYRIDGAENIATAPGLVVIANHPTLIDVVILLSLYPQSNCVIKSAVTRNIFMRSTVAAADYISNDSPEMLLESCVDYLKSGGSLLLFPEGTRTHADERIVFKPGAATIAARSQARVQPIAIRCHPVFLTRETPWHYVPRTKPQYAIRIMPAIAISDLVSTDVGERHVRQDLNTAILGIISHELDELAEPGGVESEVDVA
jgi:1-acyl-sn-glycerol-3-phosphate acyltransferase